MTEPRTPWSPWSYGCVGGLLASSGVTLCGALLALQPETILMRAAIGGVLVACGVQIAATIIHMVQTTEQDD